MTWELTGIPYTSAREAGGIADAIVVLRQLGLAARLADFGVEDAGDLALLPPSGERGPSGLLNEDALATLVDATRQHVRETLDRDRLPLLVGGDCPVMLGPLAAIRDTGERPGLVMIDGHEDAWPPMRSETGEASDSEVAIALGRVSGLPTALSELMPLLTASAVAQIGPRDEAELDAAHVPSLRSEIAFFASGQHVVARSYGPETLVRAAIDAIDADSFWLHIDLDVLATPDFAAVDYRQPGGVDWATLDGLASTAAPDAGCRGISVVIYNPALDADHSDGPKVIEFLARLTAELVR
ncbi:MAG TPA: arginase family protein [Baekduia sp.]|nr:arginase family protein [Baekduia sp.]